MPARVRLRFKQQFRIPTAEHRMILTDLLPARLEFRMQETPR
jgi:hypothetical protein